MKLFVFILFLNVMMIETNAQHAKISATIIDATWLTGSWKGENNWGVSEESWTTAAGGSMACLYRLTKDGKTIFYEFLTLTEFEGSLKLRLKHFSDQMKAWEEKEQTVDFLLTEKKEGKLIFAGDLVKKTITIEKLSAQSIQLTLESIDDGNKTVTVFLMKRVLP